MRYDLTNLDTLHEMVNWFDKHKKIHDENIISQLQRIYFLNDSLSISHLTDCFAVFAYDNDLEFNGIELFDLFFASTKLTLRTCTIELLFYAKNQDLSKDRLYSLLDFKVNSKI